MQKALARARATRRVAARIGKLAPSSPLTQRTLVTTSRLRNTDQNPVRFSDYARKASPDPTQPSSIAQDLAARKTLETPAAPTHSDRAHFVQRKDGQALTYVPKGAAAGIELQKLERLIKVKDLASGAKKSLWAHTLRDACTCSRCRDPTSGQKNFSQADVPVDEIGIELMEGTREGLRIAFSNDMQMEAWRDLEPHRMLLSWETLERLVKGEEGFEAGTGPVRDRLVRKTGIVSWDRDTIAASVRSIDFDEFIRGGEAMWDAITDLSRYGLVFLKNVPEREDSIERITTTIAPIKETFYGRLFDVRAKPNAENVAYTSHSLCLHQDLLYLESPPHIQILHCLENSCEGGESLFADGDRVGRALLAAAAAASADKASGLSINALKTRIPYRYDKNGFFYAQKRPFIETAGDKGATFESLWWSPPFAAARPTSAFNLEPLFRAVRAAQELLHREANMYERKMEPGECVLFDNRRVMHGRRAFDARGGGSRWLRGAYISCEDFYSRAAYIPDGHAEATRGGAALSRAQADEEVAASELTRIAGTLLAPPAKGSRPKEKVNTAARSGDADTETVYLDHA